MNAADPTAAIQRLKPERRKRVQCGKAGLWAGTLTSGPSTSGARQPGAVSGAASEPLCLCRGAYPIIPPTRWRRKCYTDRLMNTICLTAAFDSLPPAYNSLRWSKSTNTIPHFPFIYVVKKKQSQNVLLISHNVTLSFLTKFACTAC